MSGETVVVTPDDGDASAEFAAGVATAEAAQARQDVAELEVRAGMAEQQAADAQAAAGAAVTEAYDARAALESFRGEVGDLIGGIAARMEELAAAREAAPEQPAEVPAPEPEPEPETPAEEPKPKRHRYGSKAFFGSRAYEDD